MKISKLFHWLYAVLMFLPIFAIGVKCGYVIFNDNAYSSYSGSYAYSGTSYLNDYYPYSDLIYNQSSGSVTGYVTDFSLSGLSTPLVATIPNVQYGEFLFNGVLSLSIDGVDYDVNNQIISLGNENSGSFGTNSLRIFNQGVDFNSLEWSSIYMSSYQDRNGVATNTFYRLTAGNHDIIITFTDNTIRYLSAGTSLSTFETFYSSIQVVSYIVDTNLSSVFYSSLQELDNNEFFGWAKNSFLTAPIMYIGNLFGITNPHPIFTLMSYWLAVSIIWLVFDLVMYVPLLIHRWLDKGVVE